MSHAETVSMEMKALPSLDFELLLSLARDNPDRYTNMRSSLIDSTIGRLDTSKGGLAELQRKIDSITGKESAPDQAMLDIARLLSERISALAALTRILHRELQGKARSVSP